MRCTHRRSGRRARLGSASTSATAASSTRRFEDGIEDNAHVFHPLRLVRRVVNRRAEEPVGERVAGMIRCDDDVAPRRETFAEHRVRRASPGTAMGEHDQGMGSGRRRRVGQCRSGEADTRQQLVPRHRSSRRRAPDTNSRGPAHDHRATRRPPPRNSEPPRIAVARAARRRKGQCPRRTPSHEPPDPRRHRRLRVVTLLGSAPHSPPCKERA